ncbi:hypothetical protein [Halocatena marina]|uniref:hypothetical protein n=1 Tax=Halocatena marina TaxID=2934937 RepID=UPI00200C3FDA|nr:hypothetical protein [Halocatena marina]
MNARRITALALVFSVLLAGCSAIEIPTGPEGTPSTESNVGDTPSTTDSDSTATTTDGSTPAETAATTTIAETATEVATTTPTPTATTTKTIEVKTTTATNTATEATATESGWSEPTPPTRPTEEKLEERITNTKFINKEQATSSSGYSNFDVQIFADTRLKNVDPEGDVDGEPYFIIEINDKLVARASVTFEKNGSFAIEVPTAALKQFDSGTLNVRVSFLDQDSHSDDLYDTWSGTIEYSAS